MNEELNHLRKTNRDLVSVLEALNRAIGAAAIVGSIDANGWKHLGDLMEHAEAVIDHAQRVPA